jgi:uncharacterized protein
MGVQSGISDRRGLVAFLRSQFKVNWHGDHGIPHWARVRVNGFMLATDTGANRHVIELFAFFHDAGRRNEWTDDGHGGRGALLARQLKGLYFDATDIEMDLLQYACEHHSGGKSSGDPTVLTCWDADRLDLGRVGITPDPRRLCTEAARLEQNLQRAHQRALVWRPRHVP